jgi:hypothetical protein
LKSSLTHRLTFSQDHVPQFDLLGGLPDTPSEVHSENDRYSEDFPAYKSAWEPIHGGNEATSFHRAGVQRGPIDAKFEDALDYYGTDVKTVKNGKKDGVYLFGTRIVKAELNSLGDVVVPLGKDKLRVMEFLDKFSKVEKLKLRGLAAAGPLCNFMGQQKQPIR